MNIAEGTRRMQQAGRWLIGIPLIVVIVFICISLFVQTFPQIFGMIVLAELLLSVMVSGAILWLAGWILEGFAKDTP